MPFFNERLSFFFEDGSVAQSKNLAKMNEREIILMPDFNAQMAQPPKDSHLAIVHRHMHFY
jgi:hypothetical protein